MKYTIAFLTYCLGAGAALAHPGHESALTQGALHWLGEIDHLAVVGFGAAAIGLGAARVLRMIGRKKSRAACLSGSGERGEG